MNRKIKKEPALAIQDGQTGKKLDLFPSAKEGGKAEEEDGVTQQDVVNELWVF